MTNLDRSEINRALAKAIAYKQCGKDTLAHAWAVHLIDLLDASAILDQTAAMYARGELVEV